MPAFRFTPIYQERVWGSDNFERVLGRKYTQEGPIGESWEIVDRPEAQSVDPISGKTLHQLIATESAHVMGPNWDRRDAFPILVKWLDCKERLSLQVHPPAAIAPKFHAEPKTECWYFAGVDEGSSVCVGVKDGVTKEAFDKAIRENTLEDCVHTLATEAGDSIFIPSGRLHAINGGNLILEIQQNSDTTYRVYDWGRVGLDGKPRELHVDKALECIDFRDTQPELKKASGETTECLADCEHFRITLHRKTACGHALEFRAGEQPRILSMAKGSAVLTQEDGQVELIAGDNLLLPFGEKFSLQARGESVVLVTDNFI